MNSCMVEITLKQLLEARGMSMYALAKDTGLAYTTLWKLQSGDSQGISFDVLEKVCGALECTPNDLLAIKPDKRKSQR